MAASSPTPFERDQGEPGLRRMRLTWRLLAGSFALLGAAGITAIATHPSRLIDAVILVLIGISALAAIGHRRSVGALEAGRRAEAEHVARILRGLSRSASPDAIVDAIAQDLAAGTGADHTVVVRCRPDERTLEATLASARPGVPSATTRLALSDLDPGRSGAERAPVAIPIVSAAEPAGRPLLVPLEAVTSRLEARVRAVFGLSNTLAAPLRTERGAVIGAIVVSRRTDEPWPAAARRILQGAAVEASAALGRVESHRAAEARASTDALTGLPNRRYFDEFTGLLARRRRADDAVGVLMVDIDHFKRINDRFGHDVGDAVLRQVAGAIAGAVRDGDVPARMGGEEFAVLLRNATEVVAIEVAERVRAAVSRLELGEASGSGVRPSVSVSVGVAVQTGPDEAIADLLAEADRALYRAKRAGRDRVVAA